MQRPELFLLSYWGTQLIWGQSCFLLFFFYFEITQKPIDILTSAFVYSYFTFDKMVTQLEYLAGKKD